MLIIARIVQGAAGAMVSPAALSLLTTTNAEGAARNRTLAIWQATTAAGATAGIVAGGLLTQYFGWRAAAGGCRVSRHMTYRVPLTWGFSAVSRRWQPGSVSIPWHFFTRPSWLGQPARLRSGLPPVG
jgi:MFS family permease